MKAGMQEYLRDHGFKLKFHSSLTASFTNRQKWVRDFYKYGWMRHTSFPSVARRLVLQHHQDVSKYYSQCLRRTEYID